MARKFTALSTTRVPSGMPFSQAKTIPQVVHLSDAALDAMLDLQYVRPEIISPDKLMYDARMEMQQGNHLHLVFVVNNANRILGFLSLEKILTEVPIQTIEQKRVKREDILVKDVMLPINKVATLNYDNLKLAKVGDIVATFKEEKQHYLLVMQFDKKLAAPIIRGFFMASLLSVQLGMDILSDLPDRAKTLAELNHILWE